MSRIRLRLALQIYILSKHPQIIDDAQLLLWLHQRNQQAVKLIYDRYAALMFGVIKCVVKDEKVAAELLKQCFEYVWKKTEKYNSVNGELRDWLLYKARVRAINHLRTKRLRDGAHVEEDQRPWDQLLTDEAQLVDKHVMDHLDADAQQLFSIIYFSAFSEEEAMDHLGIDLPSLRLRAKKAFAQLSVALT